MGRYDGYLLCSDLDGTFINSSKQLIEKNLEAVEYFIDEGGLFTLATGRMPMHLVDNFHNKIKINTYLICFNGTVIYDFTKQINVYERFIDEKIICDFDSIEREYRTLCKNILYYTDFKSYDNYRLIDKKEKIHKIVFDALDKEVCDKLKIYLNKKYGENCELNKSWTTGLELIPKNSGKGECIKQLRNLLKRNINKVIAVGDYENDITMIEEADIGYAVANAIDSLKNVADKITVSNNDGAIAKIIEEM